MGEKKGEERGFLHYDFDRAVQRWSFWYWMIVETHPNFQNLNLVHEGSRSTRWYSKN